MFRQVASCCIALATLGLVSVALTGCGSKVPIESRPDVMDVNRLIQQLDADSKTSRLAAINHLASLGSEAQPAVEKLQDIADADPDEPVRNAARRAIEEIQGN